MGIVLPDSDRIAHADQPRARGFISWSPTERTQLLLDDVLAVLDEYRLFLPLTARQIFYRLVGTMGYGKTERDYKRLTEALNKARRSGIVPFNSIRDDGTTISQAPGADSEAMLVSWMRTLAENGLNLQVDQPIRQIVLCEAGGMVPQLARVAHEYGVEVISAGGFNSLTDKHRLASDIADDGRPTLLWHIGDFDPSGVHVFQSLADDVSAFAERMGANEISFKRLAVTEAQIEEFQLPTAPAKRTDNRAFQGDGTVQAEAIPPNDLAEILHAALQIYFDVEVKESIEDRTADVVERLGPVLDEIDLDGCA